MSISSTITPRRVVALCVLCTLAACTSGRTPPPSAPGHTTLPAYATTEASNTPTALALPPRESTPTTSPAHAVITTYGPAPQAAVRRVVTLHVERAVVPKGPAGAWDAGLMDPGAMAIHEGRFHMLYNAVSSFPAPIGIGYASSPDGLSWTREMSAPVLTAADIPWAPAPVQLRATSLLVEDGLWTLYFTASDDVTRLYGQIGRATASTPTGPWRVDPEPVIVESPRGQWDAGGICCAKVVRQAGGYRMYYAAIGGIGVAESADGLRWRKGEQLQIADAIADPSVHALDDGWLMVYKAVDGMRRATSSDGLHWTTGPEGPLFGQLPVGDVIFGNLLLYQGKAWLYFEAGGQRTSVYLATWPESGGQHVER